MPRKVKHGLDYYDDFGDYEDYDDNYGDDYEYELEENGIETAESESQETIKTRAWRCPICTYDNEDSMSACEMCGVLRNPLVKVSGSDNNAAVGTECKDSGLSVMAMSLFASSSRQMPKTSATFKAKNDVLVTEGRLNLHKLGNGGVHFHDIHNVFSSQNKDKFNIATFKFDVPSPDDLVTNRMHSSRSSSKANLKKAGSSDASSSDKGKNILVETEFTDESDSSLASKTKDSHGLKSQNNHVPEGGKPDDLIGNMHNMSLSSKSAKTDNLNQRRAKSNSDYKPEKWMMPDHVEDRLSQLNLAIVGHVDSGKSTLSGRLLHLLGHISQKEMHKYEKEAKLQGKGSFAYAWALDESAEERERGITMTVAVAFFNSKKYQVVLLDSPGHRDFVPNMISGATQADAAILVIDASIGAFEAGLDATGGQTREHVQLIRSFGVDQIIVAVNKMDVLEYSKERFDTIKQKLGAFLRTCGFKDSSVLWVPVSAMENQNLVANPSDQRLSSWFRGPCLLDAIDSLQLPSRDYSKPLLMPICDVVKPLQGQVSACGKLETGALKTGSKVLVMPSREIATVRSLERDSKACNIARAGDNVTVNLQGIEGSRVIAGGVLCHPDFPVAVANHLELKILVLEVSTPILIGSQLEFHAHHAKEAARVTKILSLLDPKTGKVTKKSPRCLLAKQNAVIEVVLQGPICVEAYSNCRALGRVSLRSSGRTIALGVVNRIVETAN